MKVSEFKGSRTLVRLECSCGGLWIRYGNRAEDRESLRKFVEEHGDHEAGRFIVSSSITRA